MGRLKWFDRFLNNESVAQNQFLSHRLRKNRFLRPIKEITSTMGLSPDLNRDREGWLCRVMVALKILYVDGKVI